MLGAFSDVEQALIAVQQQAVREAESSLARARADLERAEREFQRNEALYQQKVLTESEFNQVQYNLAVSRANLTSAEVSLERAQDRQVHVEEQRRVAGLQLTGHAVERRGIDDALRAEQRPQAGESDFHHAREAVRGEEIRQRAGVDRNACDDGGCGVDSPAPHAGGAEAVGLARARRQRDHRAQPLEIANRAVDERAVLRDAERPRANAVLVRHVGGEAGKRPRHHFLDSILGVSVRGGVACALHPLLCLVRRQLREQQGFSISWMIS